MLRLERWRDIREHLITVAICALVTLLGAAHFSPSTPIPQVARDTGLLIALILPLGIVRGVALAFAPLPLAGAWLSVAPGDPLPLRTLITGGLLYSLAMLVLPRFVSHAFHYFDRRRALARQLGCGGGAHLMDKLARSVRSGRARRGRESRSPAQPQREPLPLGSDPNVYDALVILGAVWPELRYLISFGFESDPSTDAQRATIRLLHGQAEVLVSGANWDELLINLAKMDAEQIRAHIEESTRLLPRYAAHYVRIKDSEERAREAARAKAAPPS